MSLASFRMFSSFGEAFVQGADHTTCKEEESLTRRSSSIGRSVDAGGDAADHRTKLGCELYRLRRHCRRRRRMDHEQRAKTQAKVIESLKDPCPGQQPVVRTTLPANIEQQQQQQPGGFGKKRGFAGERRRNEPNPCGRPTCWIAARTKERTALREKRRT